MDKLVRRFFGRIFLGKSPIFIPKITKERENEFRAVNTAKEIESIIRNHNRLFQQKIHFGIGVHSGQIGVEMSKAHQIKFVSLDNTLSITKRIADHSDGPVYISEPLHRKTIGKIRAEKLQGTRFDLSWTNLEAS